MALRRSVADIVGAEVVFASPAARAAGARPKPVNMRTPNETASACRFMVFRPFPPGRPRIDRHRPNHRRAGCRSGAPPNVAIFVDRFGDLRTWTMEEPRRATFLET